MVNRFEYDNQGRQRKIIENFMAVSSSSASETSSETSNSSEEGCPGSDDTNRTTQMTYTPEGQLATLTAINAATGNQVTTYTYGTTLTDSAIASSSLLREVEYPDSSSGSDVVSYTYNRQSERTGQTDQNGNVRQFEYDLLGRQTQDRVVTLGAGVDAAVRRIETAYDVRGLVARISSYDQATVGTGSVVNEVRSAYNDFAQPITSWQAHSSAVDTMSTPKVQYEYADGSDNTIRPMAILYPNGRQLNYDYGSANGINDSLSRVAAIVEESSSVNLAQYQYLGAQAVVQVDSTQADLQYTLVDLTDTNDPDTGDIYSGLDRFGRVKDVRWRNTDMAADLSRVQYGYNRASNRIWRKNPTDPNEQYDWLYTYDGLQRLKDAQRGTLNSTHTALSSQDFAQCWSLDATGNWQQFRQADEGSSWSLEQQRTANPVNEITGIENSVGPAWAQLAYDANGNMTTIPHPTGAASLASSSSSSSSEEIPAGFTATYDAWNRLVKLADAETAATVQENQYDGRYFRTLRKDYAEGTLDQTRHFYYTDAWRCVEERLDTETTPDRQFVWGIRYIDDLICRDRSTTGTLNERLYALPDGNRNVTALVNTSGAVAERLEYDPYGNTTWLTAGFVVEDGSQFEWEVTYCGYRWDAASSMFQVRFRWYSPLLGAWVSRDPIIQESNLHTYCYCSPLTKIDPSGMSPELTAVKRAAKTTRTSSPLGTAVSIGLMSGLVLYPLTEPLVSPMYRRMFDWTYGNPPLSNPRRVDCRKKHPEWPECPINRSKEPLSVAVDFLKKHCRCQDIAAHQCTPITEIKTNCGKGGGTQHNCTLQDCCGSITDDYRVSVRCCNCCSGPSGKSTESVSCAAPHWSNSKVPPQC